MKKKLIIWISIGALLTISIIKIDEVKIFFKNCKFAFVSWSIARRGYLDEIWDYEKVKSPTGYDMWMIGKKDDELTAVCQATPSRTTFIGRQELNMDFRFRMDYDTGDGYTIFKNFIEEYYNNKGERP